MHDVPYGYCECGCGEKAAVSRYTSTFHGYVAGKPRRFKRGHNGARPLAERFWEHVDRDGPAPTFRPSLGGCWLWTGYVRKDGYGEVSDRRRRKRLAHQVAYELAVGPIPDGLQIDHLCRVRHCARPTHLEAVTNWENGMRGFSPAALNVRKTHCLRGHPYDEENTYVTPDGARRCQACHRLDERARYHARKKLPGGRSAR